MKNSEINWVLLENLIEKYSSVGEKDWEIAKRYCEAEIQRNLSFESIRRYVTFLRSYLGYANKKVSNSKKVVETYERIKEKYPDKPLNDIIAKIANKHVSIPLWFD